MKRRRLLLTPPDSPGEPVFKKAATGGLGRGAAEGSVYIQGEDRSAQVHRDRVAQELHEAKMAGQPIPPKTTAARIELDLEPPPQA